MDTESNSRPTFLSRFELVLLIGLAVVITVCVVQSQSALASPPAAAAAARP